MAALWVDRADRMVFRERQAEARANGTTGAYFTEKPTKPARGYARRRRGLQHGVGSVTGQCEGGNKNGLCEGVRPPAWAPGSRRAGSTLQSRPASQLRRAPRLRQTVVMGKASIFGTNVPPQGMEWWGVMAPTWPTPLPFWHGASLCRIPEPASPRPQRASRFRCSQE